MEGTILTKTTSNIYCMDSVPHNFGYCVCFSLAHASGMNGLEGTTYVSTRNQKEDETRMDMFEERNEKVSPESSFIA